MTSDGSSLAFPNASRSKLDRVLADLVESAQEVLATQGRLRSLLDATRAVSGELELPSVLRRIIEVATELVGARYGAIGVIGADGTLDQFIHVGMPDDMVHVIGHLPEGRGLLGALIEEQEPIRLEHLSDDPRSAGFPHGHPPMDSFLGVPVRVRDEVYGNLYLSESKDGAFSDEDQELLMALAATAGAAIDHARLFDESQRRQRWSAASAEVTSALLSDQAEDSLAILADRVAALADADLVCVTIPLGPSTMSVEVARGHLAASVAGTTFASAGTLTGRAHESGQPVMADSLLGMNTEPPLALGPSMAIPLTPLDQPSGVLLVSRLPGRPRFSPADLDMAADFAAQAGVALRLVIAREDSQRLVLLEDRGRIARDLHDHVIQRLFGAGLSLQAIAGSLPEPRLRTEIARQVDALDAAIAEIRTAIFTLTSAAHSDAPSVRHRVIDLLGEMAGMFPTSPRVTFGGPVDLMVPLELVDDLVAVVREGLTNVAKHAEAESTSVVIAVDEDVLSVVIEDDGIGFTPDPGGRRSGTGNIAERAALRGGDSEIVPREPRGTILRWSVPISGRETP